MAQQMIARVDLFRIQKADVDNALHIRKTALGTIMGMQVELKTIATLKDVGTTVDQGIFNSSRLQIGCANSPLVGERLTKTMAQFILEFCELPTSFQYKHLQGSNFNDCAQLVSEFLATDEKYTSLRQSLMCGILISEKITKLRDACMLHEKQSGWVCCIT
ncbi:MAG TPA: hypothetical protein VN457_07510 [Chlamydiales bacterium]|nr:hypothetical protein [Chlamydiales bacterium]